jgi:colanic acid biosynthesis glycosyl transferase WcaI
VHKVTKLYNRIYSKKIMALNQYRVLILNHLFYPDQTALSQIITDLSLGLSEKGWSVEIVCSRHQQIKSIEAFNYQQFQNISINYVRGSNFGKAHLIGRLVDYITFNFFALLKAVSLKRFDVVIVTTAPPFLGLIGLVVKLFHKSKLVYNIQDLYPHTAVQLGVLKNKSLIMIFEALLKMIFKYSDQVIAIGEDMAVKINEVYPKAKIDIIHNWANGDEIYPIKKEDNIFINKNGFSGKFLIIYSGNYGLAHEFDAFIDAAEELKLCQNIHFVFIGDGNYRDRIHQEVSRKRLFNVSLLPYQPKSVLKYSLAAADIALVSLTKGLEGCIVPSKIYGLMASGKSILFLGSRLSCISQILETAQCGFTVESSDEIVKYILQQYNDQEITEKFGKNSRAYFETNFNRTLAVEKYHSILLNVVAS